MRIIDETIEKELRERVPNWVKMVNDAKKVDVDYLIMVLDAFADDF